jgi:fructokinase
MGQAAIGVDLGGTKTEIAIVDGEGAFLFRRRVPTPSADYEAILATIAGLVAEAEAEYGARLPIGVGIPGAISPASGKVKNASLLALNGHPLDRDLASRLGRAVRVENDANCFALSEARGGAGAGSAVVFGVILGTGCGGGVVVGGSLVSGRHRIAGEWGHMPLPWPSADEYPGKPCWCGRHGCLERYLAGPELAAEALGPGERSVERALAAAAAGEKAAAAALSRHVDRLARGLSLVIDLLDPDVIVLGGGLSNLDHLYEEVPPLLPRYVFSDTAGTPIRRNRFGDSSGVRGAALLAMG